jgi:hypothetical protein
LDILNLRKYLFNYFEAFARKAVFDFFYMLEALGFHAYAQIATVNRLRVAVLVVYGNNVAAAIRNDFGNGNELTGLVDKLDNDGAGSAALVKTTVYDS